MISIGLLSFIEGYLRLWVALLLLLMIIYIYTDAGLRHQEPRIGVFAYKIDLGTRVLEGVEELVPVPRGAGEAEMKAIVRSLQKATLYRELFASHTIVIYTDSAAAIHAFNAQLYDVKRRYHEIRYEFLKIRAILKQRIVLKHIKSTRGAERARATGMHYWCHLQLNRLLRLLTKERVNQNIEPKNLNANGATKTS